MFRTVLTSLLAVLVLCGSAFAAEKTLIAAANPTWPPMEFLDENKNIIGYDRDIIAAIAEEIGMKSEFRNIAWDGIFASLESGQANVIASCVTITDKRKKAYVFSDPYYEVHQAVVVAKDSAIKKPEDLKGKKVGVQIGTTAIEALRKMNVDIDLRTYDEVGLVFEDMRNGRLDVVVCDDPVARYYASRKEGYKDLMKVAFLTEDVEYIGFVFSKDNAELAAQVNKGLKARKRPSATSGLANSFLKLKIGEGKGKLSKESFPFPSPNPTPFLSKTFVLIESLLPVFPVGKKRPRPNVSVCAGRCLLESINL